MNRGPLQRAKSGKELWVRKDLQRATVAREEKPQIAKKYKKRERSRKERDS